MHGASLALEDAAVLGSLFSRLRSRSRSEISRLLSAFQEIRQARWEFVKHSELSNVTLLTLSEDSEEWKLREAAFVASREKEVLDWDDIEDPYLQQAWEEVKIIFGYEAYDAADDWWIDWGIMQQRLKASNASSDLDLERRSNASDASNGPGLGVDFSRIVVSKTSE
jgi:salicylate hydroxylase